MNKSSVKKVVGITVFILIVILFFYNQNNDIAFSQMKIVSADLPEEFNGYKILQISDLHSKTFGKNQQTLVKKIILENPDVIFVTGDLIDSKNYNTDVCLQLCSQMSEIATVYFVTGNHEAWSNKFDAFEVQLKDAGVKVLRNESEFITLGNSKILVIGVDDPDFQGYDNMMIRIDELIKPHPETYSIVLSHRPELFTSYAERKIDLIFSGHAHGGQIRLPFIGGLVSPNQGWFPRFTSGIYSSGKTSMIVSRGLGNSIIPQRLFNKPELVVVTLMK